VNRKDGPAGTAEGDVLPVEVGVGFGNDGVGGEGGGLK
jgi:hypothetical protein